MKNHSPFVTCGIGMILGLLLLANLSIQAWGKHGKTVPRVSFVRRDGGRLDIVRNPEADEPINFLGQIDGNYKYLIVRKSGHCAYISAYYKRRHLFDVQDVDINDITSDWKPGVANNGYDFYMSPNRRYLFVNRYLISDLDVALLYRKSGRRWEPAGPIRFDDVALQAYCNYRHIDPDKLSGPSRAMRLVRWDMRRGTLVFWMSAASFWFSDKAQRGDIAATWTASCRLSDMRFHIISDKIYRFDKPGRLPR